jgi:hypothetical protein
MLMLTAGCGEKKEAPKMGGGSGGDNKPAADTGSKTASTGERTALKSPVTGTLKGRVTFVGQVPAAKDFTEQMEKQADKSHCLQGPKTDPEWMVSADKGVANVIVWLRPPDGKYFDIPGALRHRADEVKMDQPYCMFEPHVLAINPSTWDPQTKKQVPTAQVFKIVNSAPINHNTAWSGNKLLNSGKNEILPAKKGSMAINAKACRETDVGGEELLAVNCDIHKWMNAYVGVFDHPYYAVTDKDGNYEIKEAPADAELTVAYWHQSFNPKSIAKGAKTEKMKLNPGENKKDFKIEAP